MTFLVWALVGLMCGVVVDLVSRNFGMLEDIIVGIAGSVVAGFAFGTVTGAPITLLDPLDAGVAISGALLFIALSRGLTRGRSAI